MDKAPDKYKSIIEEFDQVEKELQNPTTINNPQKLQEFSQKHAELKGLQVLAGKIIKYTKEIEENIKLSDSEDIEMSSLAKDEINRLKEEIAKLEGEFKKLVATSDPNDKRDIILEIRAGTGGEEAALFAADLFRMYTKYAEANGWEVKTLNTNYTGNGGFKEIIASVEGQNVYSKLKYENGVHRVQRVPTTESSGRIHTSAASVVILPEVNDVPDIDISDQDIKIDVYRAGGPGGQSVNTTDSAVRITHLPTGTVVTCQDEKSQHKNKARAMSILKSKLYQIKQEEISKKADSQRKSAIKTGDRSAKIRTYNFPQGRITDHRIKKNWHNLDEVLDGKLDEIISETQEEITDEIDM
ncbi:peptide chain release factor 1 [Candidatus Dojkabacteria bacterium]|nr:peptide chain release factor 1 [Candidatus Dojkabacteria bacterium]